jgi:hypothetical protein
MLEAVDTNLVFTISLKRSTQNLQLSTKLAGRLPHLWVKSRHAALKLQCPLYSQKRTLVERVGMSALGHFRTHAVQQIGSYSITSSARATSEGGTVMPSALAVFRLMTISYLVGACTGRSAGFSPLRMRST